MLWPERLLGSPPEVRVPAGYALRTYRDSDDEAYLALYQAAGWEGGATALDAGGARRGAGARSRRRAPSRRSRVTKNERAFLTVAAE